MTDQTDLPRLAHDADTELIDYGVIDPEEPLKPNQPYLLADDPAAWYSDAEIIASLKKRIEDLTPKAKAWDQVIALLTLDSRWRLYVSATGNVNSLRLGYTPEGIVVHGDSQVSLEAAALKLANSFKRYESDMLAHTARGAQ